MTAHDPDKEVQRKRYTPLEALKDVGNFLAFMAIAAVGLYIAEVIVKVLLYGLEHLRGSPYPELVKNMIDYFTIALFLLFVAVYGILHIKDFWRNLQRGWNDTGETQRDPSPPAQP